MGSALICPRDGVGTLLDRQSGRRGEFRADVCPRCGGVWFDKGEITRLTGDREVERLVVDYAAGASEFPCPRCARAMASRPVGDVAVDVCTNCHGVWFDRDELETVARTMAGERVLEGTGPITGGFGHWEALTMAAFASPSMLKKLMEPRRSQLPPSDRI